MSTISIQKTTVGGLKGLVLENEKLRSVIMLDLGARIISLIYKPTETEFTWHNPKVPIKEPNYEIEFEDISGFFDCVPTAEPCTFKGKRLRARGEVASERWSLVKTEKTSKFINVTMECACKAHPLTIRKRISISKAEPILHLRYALRNLSDEKLEYHYSAHNTLCTTPYHRIILPQEVSKLKLGPVNTDHLGKLGDEVSWPQAVDKNGNPVALDKPPSPCAGVAENLFTPKLRETWCASINEARKDIIGF